MLVNLSCQLGASGTGKSHLLISLGVAACEQGRRVRYVTTAQLVNELVEAADDRKLSVTVRKMVAGGGVYWCASGGWSR